MPPSANVDVKVLSTFVDDCELVVDSVDVVVGVDVVKVVSWLVVEPMSFKQSARIAFIGMSPRGGVPNLVERENYADVPTEEAVDEVLETLVVSAELLAVTVTMTTDEDGDEVLELETLVVPVASLAVTVTVIVEEE
ncbi:hypothetical protein VPNG_05631 [Cytospora leucostoma]|uniref:Uncharacterized protein n=1 Tax=Cytospora leucostoma TaxID=1230097 RepID=A0A423X7K6_9PEZI|nr:hypothetical protein VPNG_05631 [Cytospora leucostoma]